MGSENEIQLIGVCQYGERTWFEAESTDDPCPCCTREGSGDEPDYKPPQFFVPVAVREADQERIAWLERRGDSLAATVAEVCDELSEEGWRINRLHDALTEYRASLSTGEERNAE